MDEDSLSTRCYYVKKNDLSMTKHAGLPRRSRKFFRIGKLSDAQNPDIREILSSSSRGATKRYIYFQGLYDDGITAPDGDVTTRVGEYKETFSFLESLNLYPFMHLDLSLASPEGAGYCSDYAIHRLSEFFNMMKTKGMPSCWRNGRFDVSHRSSDDNVAFMEGYAAIHKTIKSFGLRMEVGFHCSLDSGYFSGDLFEQNLIACRHYGCEPDFVSIALAGGRPGNVYDDNHKLLARHAMHIITDTGANVGRLYILDRWTNFDGAGLGADVSPAGIYGEFNLYDYTNINTLHDFSISRMPGRTALAV
ncbi:MAG: hypothetical protein LBT23_05245 [Synergistaceae bacterium]|jgi:hypothetical protein|nr:hypothetical protein [Synergistaceae bacterium]